MGKFHLKSFFLGKVYKYVNDFIYNMYGQYNGPIYQRIYSGSVVRKNLGEIPIEKSSIAWIS